MGELDRILAERSEWTADANSAEAPADVAPAATPTDTAAPAVLTNIPWTVRALAGHVDRTRDVAVSPDGSRIASAGADGRAIIWDTETGEHLLTLAGHKGWVDAVAFSPDGRLATGGRDNTVKMWSVAGHTGGVYSIAFSPDGATLATAGGDRTLRLWDLTTGTPRWRHTLSGHTDKIYRLAFDPAGGRVATAGFDSKANLWDVASGDLLSTLEGHKDQLRELAFSPDGQRLATASADGTALLYTLDAPDVNSTRIPVTHNKPDIQASAVAFHPSRPEWVTGGWDGTLQLWDFSGNNLGRIVHPNADRPAPPQFIDIAFSRDGAEITALTGHKVYVWPVTAFGRAQAKPSAPVTVAGAKLCNSYRLQPGREAAGGRLRRWRRTHLRHGYAYAGEDDHRPQGRGQSGGVQSRREETGDRQHRQFVPYFAAAFRRVVRRGEAAASGDLRQKISDNGY